MGKQKRELNPADSFRREQKKLEGKKNKIAKKKVTEVRELLNDHKKIEEKLEKLKTESDQNKLDKGLKDQIKQLQEMHRIAVNKAKINGTYQSKSDVETSGQMSSSQDTESDTVTNTFPTSSSETTTISSFQSSLPSKFPSIPRRPDESIYYHPVYNPSGEPPPGQPQIYRPPQPPKITISGGTSNVPQQRSMPIPIGGQNGIPLPSPQLQRNIPIGGMNGIPPPPPPPLHMGVMPPPRPIYFQNPNQPTFQPPPPPIPTAFPSPFSNFPVPPQPFHNQDTSSSSHIEAPGNADSQATAIIARPSRANHMNSFDPLDPTKRSFTERFSSSSESSKPKVAPMNPVTANKNNSASKQRPSEPPQPPSYDNIVENSVPKTNALSSAIDTSGSINYNLTVDKPEGLKSFDDIQIPIEDIMRRRFEVITDEVPSAGPSLPVSMSNNSFKPDSQPTGLDILGDYGDSDNDSDEKDNESTVMSTHLSTPLPAPQKSSVTSQQTYSTVTQVQASFASQSEVYMQHPSFQEHPSQHFPQSHASHSTNYTLDQLSQAGNTSQFKSQFEQPESFKPAVVKPDSKLTRFIPSSLKVKRQLPTAPVQSKLLKQTPVDNSKVTSGTSTTSSTINTKPVVTHVDDAYKKFLDEISALDKM